MDSGTEQTMTTAMSTMKSLAFGIEIETVGIGKEALTRAIHGAIAGSTMDIYTHSVVDAHGRRWKVVADASLAGYTNGEIVSPKLNYTDIETVQSVVRAVRVAGAQADRSCGIHIHVDGSRFDPKGVINLVKMVHKQERLIEHALGISAARLSQYCRPINADFIARIESRRPRTMTELNAAWYGRENRAPHRYDSSRYHGLNLNSFFFRNTIEFRYFGGTVHAGKVKAYIQLVLALAARALTTKAASSKRREFSAETAKYDFRVFLLQLGLIGEEFKTARTHLTGALAGSAAWKGARRDRRPANESGIAETAAVETEEGNDEAAQ